MQKQLRKDISSTTLHWLAMVFMLCESLCITFVQNSRLLRFAGGLAYPIFAFMIVEGYFYTSDLKSYVKRLLLLAIVSEIPFNLIYSSTIIYPFQQNAIWALLLGLLLVHLNETIRKNNEQWFSVIVMILSFVISVTAGNKLICDYCGTGTVMVLAFYIFRGRKWWCFAGQTLALYYVNVIMAGGESVQFNICSTAFAADIQVFTLLALVPIWFYKGRQGSCTQNMRKLFYGFYPLHMLVLAMLFING